MSWSECRIMIHRIYCACINMKWLDYVVLSGIHFMIFIFVSKHVAENRCSLGQQKHSHDTGVSVLCSFTHPLIKMACLGTCPLKQFVIAWEQHSIAYRIWNCMLFASGWKKTFPLWNVQLCMLLCRIIYTHLSSLFKSIFGSL